MELGTCHASQPTSAEAACLSTPPSSKLNLHGPYSSGPIELQLFAAPWILIVAGHAGSPRSRDLTVAGPQICSRGTSCRTLRQKLASKMNQSFFDVSSSVSWNFVVERTLLPRYRHRSQKGYRGRKVGMRTGRCAIIHHGLARSASQAHRPAGPVGRDRAGPVLAMQ